MRPASSKSLLNRINRKSALALLLFRTMSNAYVTIGSIQTRCMRREFARRIGLSLAPSGSHAAIAKTTAVRAALYFRDWK